MKRLFAIAVVLILLLMAFAFGYGSGKKHVLTDQELWILDTEHDPSCDVEIHSFLDGEWNVYNGFIG